MTADEEEIFLKAKGTIVAKLALNALEAFLSGKGEFYIEVVDDKTKRVGFKYETS